MTHVHIFFHHLHAFCAVLWAAVIAGAVLGRIVEPEPEVINDHPELMKAQLITWIEHYFGSYPRESRSDTQIVGNSRDALFSVERNAYNARMHHNGFVSSALQRENTRKFDVSKIHKAHSAMDSQASKPTVYPYNLEWMLKNVFTYPRNYNTNETAKNSVRTYIIDYMETLSELQTSVQQFHPIQFMGLVS